MASNGENVGIKISNPTYDVTKATDYQLMFNSSWPSIAIAYESYQSVTYVSGGATTATFAHNLGFVPFTIGWISSGVTNFDDMSLSGVIEIDSTNVVVKYTQSPDDLTGKDPFGISFNTSVTISIKCYNIDLISQKDYTFHLPGQGRAPYDPNYGIKVVKQGRDVQSRDLRDFLLHSRGQSPAVLSVLTEASQVPDGSVPGWYDITYTNPANYIAWIYGFVQSTRGDGSTFYANIAIGGTAGGSTPVVEIDGPTFTLAKASADIKATLLVLRDPMFAPTTVNVTY